MNDDELGRALTDLGGHLDHPAGDGLVAAVTERVRAEALPVLPTDRSVDRSTGRRRPWPARRAVLAAVAAAVLLAGVVVTVAPAREAVARWFGIGSVVLRSDPTGGQPVGSDPVPGPGAGGPVDRANLQTAVGFTLRYPADPAAGEPVAAEVDPRPAGGLVAITYPSFALVQVGSRPGDAPSLLKSFGSGTRLERASVGGQPAWWITGAPHDLGYLDREGQWQQDTVRRAGDVLLWSVGDVTYRIEGLADRAVAERIGGSLR
jgi:hypothetical protein